MSAPSTTSFGSCLMSTYKMPDFVTTIHPLCPLLYLTVLWANNYPSIIHLFFFFFLYLIVRPVVCLSGQIFHINNIKQHEFSISSYYNIISLVNYFLPLLVLSKGKDIFFLFFFFFLLFVLFCFVFCPLPSFFTMPQMNAI
jgi:hypothetical protein